MRRDVGRTRLNPSDREDSRAAVGFQTVAKDARLVAETGCGSARPEAPHGAVLRDGAARQREGGSAEDGPTRLLCPDQRGRRLSRAGCQAGGGERRWGLRLVGAPRPDGPVTGSPRSDIAGARNESAIAWLCPRSHLTTITFC